MTHANETKRHWAALEKCDHVQALLVGIVGDTMKFEALVDVMREAVERRIPLADPEFKRRIERVLNS